MFTGSEVRRVGQGNGTDSAAPMFDMAHAGGVTGGSRSSGDVGTHYSLCCSHDFVCAGGQLGSRRPSRRGIWSGRTGCAHVMAPCHWPPVTPLALPLRSHTCRQVHRVWTMVLTCVPGDERWARACRGLGRAAPPMVARTGQTTGCDAHSPLPRQPFSVPSLQVSAHCKAACPVRPCPI